MSVPAAAVSPVAVVGRDGADGHTDTEADNRSRRDVARRWIIVARVSDRITSIDDGRTVLRDIDDIRLGWLNLDHLIGDCNNLLFDSVRHDRVGYHHDLLLRGFERARTLSLGAHRLNGIHYFLGLVDERITQVAGPGKVLVHLGEDIGEAGDGFDAVIPALFIKLRDIVSIFFDKPGRLDNLQRISRRRQNRGDQLIGIERDGCDELFEIGLASLRWSRRRRNGIGGGRGISGRRGIGLAEEGCIGAQEQQRHQLYSDIRENSLRFHKKRLRGN